MPEIVNPPPDGDDGRKPLMGPWRAKPEGRSPFVWELRVRSYELDLLGHVNNAVYMNYLEAARIEAMASIGLSLERLKKEGVHVVVAAAALRYLAPSHLHDELSVTVEVTRIGRTSVTVHQTVYNRSTDRLSVDAEIVGVFLGPDGKPMAVPPEFVKAFGPEDAA